MDPQYHSQRGWKEVYLWNEADNWSAGVPNGKYRILIAGTGENRVVLTGGTARNEMWVGINDSGNSSTYKGDGTIEIRGGRLHTGRAGYVMVGHAKDGSVTGTINLRGGGHTHSRRNDRTIRLGSAVSSGVTGTGIYNVYSGRLATGRPVYIGYSGKDKNSGRGEIHVYGGTVNLSGGGVYLDHQGDGSTTGLFHVSGSKPKSISRPRRWRSVPNRSPSQGPADGDKRATAQ